MMYRKAGELTQRPADRLIGRYLKVVGICRVNLPDQAQQAGNAVDRGLYLFDRGPPAAEC